MNLERGDLLQMEPISCRGTLKLLPIGKKNKVSFDCVTIDITVMFIHILDTSFLFFNVFYCPTTLQQKLLIGDDSGTISCYEFRKGEPQIVFQTKVFDGAISCVALGGSSPKKDKVAIHALGPFSLSLILL